MRNLKTVLLFVVTVCLVQGCDPGAGCDFYLTFNRPTMQKEYNFSFENDFDIAVHIVETFATAEGFHSSETSEDFSKAYSRDQNGIQWIYIKFLQDKDIIRISVSEMPSFKVSEASRDILSELIKRFQLEFGSDRIKVDEDCIAVR